MSTQPFEVHGALIQLPLPSKARPLDGFWMPGRKAHERLLIFVHGMGSNFYRSQFRKQLMLDAPAAGFDLLLFNNRGAEKDVATEKFRDCLADLDAALAFARRKGYRDVALLGHSTGCQKITYFQALRKDPLVKALILAGIGDDLAISRRDLGRRYAFWLEKARALVRAGKGDTILPKCLNFAAHRFLSVADPSCVEAQLFDFGGPMRHYRRLRVPVLALLPAEEAYACMPVERTADILLRKSNSRNFASIILPRADHGFKDCEPAAARAVFVWLMASLPRGRRRPLPA